MLAALTCLLALCAGDSQAWDGEWHLHLRQPEGGYCAGSLTVHPATPEALIVEVNVCGERGTVVAAVSSNEAKLRLPGGRILWLALDGEVLLGPGIQGWRGACPDSTARAKPQRGQSMVLEDDDEPAS